MAPHVGIWVMLIPNVLNDLPMYLVAIASGTVVTALSIGLLKKSVEETTVTEKVKEEKLTNEVEA